ncbi:WecB/TagA/CpsF family glycosyltransferase [Larkinella rosea]|uniref:Glycosyltransferase n=1 Tax=Larkinella rosea TaxID=2025312 RepID=A0A3P1BTH7_9BACT|nr:WecB/TagA/CpsF family glycosyltransferase [Larkinella rosea]RRB04219.1 glycosyltransferase [Larkinella rosea]
MKTDIFGVHYDVTNYDEASTVIIKKAKSKTSFGVTALAVHGLIECYKNRDLKEKVNKIDLIVPDGQPVRWAMNSFYKTGLKDRVYGPTLTLEVLKKANENGLSVFLYGSKENTLRLFIKNINDWFPNIKIAGQHADRFRDATPEEDEADIAKINASGAHIVLVGRGCPRQEVWVSNHLGKVNAAMMAVGAAFDFHAGTLPQAPVWLQKNGLEWLFRLIQEPNRLWKRYLFTNSTFIMLFIKRKVGLN